MFICPDKLLVFACEIVERASNIREVFNECSVEITES